VWTVFVFAIVVFVKMIASADVMTRGLDFQGKVLREGMEIDSEQEAALPDISDPAIRKELKCQLCQGVVMEMLQTIRGQEHELLRRLTEVEVVETLEKICSQRMSDYGLALDQRGQPTRRWTSSNVPKANGAWVTTMAVDTCNDVYNEYEEYLVSTLPTSCWTHQEEDGTWKESCRWCSACTKTCAPILSSH